MQVRQSVNVVWSEAFLRKLLGTLNAIPVAALFNGAECHLVSAAPNPISPTTPAADFDLLESTFTDYVAKAMNAQVPVNLGANVEGATQVLTWLMTTDPAVVSESVAGYYILDAAGDLVCYEMFAVAAPMTEYGDALTLVLQLPLRSFQAVA